MDSVSRGPLAEFIVANALGLGVDVRRTGAVMDLTYEGHGIQVKSSSSVQRWRLASASRMTFVIKPTSARRLGDPESNDSAPIRSGACWVFCAFVPSRRDLVVAEEEIVDVGNWRFAVVPTTWLPTRRTLDPTDLRPPLCDWLPYADVRWAVEAAIAANGSAPPAMVPLTVDEWLGREEMHLVPRDRLRRLVDASAAAVEHLSADGHRAILRLRSGAIDIIDGNRVAIRIQVDLLDEERDVAFRVRRRPTDTDEWTESPKTGYFSMIMPSRDVTAEWLASVAQDSQRRGKASESVTTRAVPTLDG